MAELSKSGVTWVDGVTIERGDRVVIKNHDGPWKFLAFVESMSDGRRAPWVDVIWCDKHGAPKGGGIRSFDHRLLKPSRDGWEKRK